jgi:hypothetical protein
MARKNRQALEPYYAQYISGVSDERYAVSLELSVFLLAMCQITEPHRILDLGSGFSSFVFRYYRARASLVPVVWSIDDDQDWLGKTRRFLDQHHVSKDNLAGWSSFATQDHEPFDLVSYDLGYMPLRTAALRTALACTRQDGFVILDDMHKLDYNAYVRAVVRDLGYTYYNLWPYTSDKLGRYSFLVRP